MLPLPAPDMDVSIEEGVSEGVVVEVVLDLCSRLWYRDFHITLAPRFLRFPDSEPWGSLKVPVIGCDVCDFIRSGK